MGIAKALNGKFFINQIQSGQGTMLMRGKIVGPVGTELSPYYLCDVFPANDAEIGIASQTLLSLDQLTGVSFYVDKATQDAAWDELQRQRRAWIARQKKTEETEAPRIMVGRVPREIAEFLAINPPSPDTEEPEKPGEDKG